MIRVALSLTAVAAALVVPLAANAAQLPTTTLTIEASKLVVEVVDTPDDRATGLMNRFSLQPDHGMLFVFDHPQPLAFWMKNTYIPLSIAFIDEGGRVINVDDMAPQTESSHWSSAPARYALEMRKGWFAEHGVKAGDRIDGIPGVKP